MKKILFLLLTAISIGATAQQVVSTTVKFNNNVTFNDSTFGNPSKVPVTIFEDTLRYTRGAGAGKILASDANGNAYWTNSSSIDTFSGTPVFPSGIKTDTIFTTGGSTGQVLILQNDTTGVFANAPFWKLTGNAGTTPGTNFIGTTDAQTLDIVANNKFRTQVDTLGRLIWSNDATLLSALKGTYPNSKVMLLDNDSIADSLAHYIVFGNLFELKTVDLTTNEGFGLRSGNIGNEIDNTLNLKIGRNIYLAGTYSSNKLASGTRTETAILNDSTESYIALWNLEAEESDAQAVLTIVDSTTGNPETITYDVNNNKWYILGGADSLSISSNNILIDGNLFINNGSQGNGKVLTSDANGNATWQSSDQLFTVDSVATTGDTTTLVTGTYTAIIASGAITDLVLRFPASPSNGDVVVAKFDFAVTTLTSDGQGKTIYGFPSSTALGQHREWRYDATTGAWY